MHFIDVAIIGIYLIIMVVFGAWIGKKSQSNDDYFVGGRNLGPYHIGLSVVATDVGGGFSIGLGGLGFTMGMSGSWMLFTGLVGAWLSAVLLIPKIKGLENEKSLLTYPELFLHQHQSRSRLTYLVASVAFIGYLGFTASQILAGAKLASSTLSSITTDQALFIMGLVAIIYTALGGIKAVIYTDTFQWIVLFLGLGFIGLPLAYMKVGGYEVIKTTLSPEYLSFFHLDFSILFNWIVSILPIWFVGLTLYQRIFACKDVKQAKKAWYIAGLLEWPFMAFMGVALGLLAKVAMLNGLFSHLEISSLDAEKAMPLLIKTVMPSGLLGIVLAAYFSAILSTADSCLMAASGSFMRDILPEDKFHLKLSKIVTACIGLSALMIAYKFNSVLDLMLYSYGFMVSGLFIPTLCKLFYKKIEDRILFWMVLAGGCTSIFLQVMESSSFHWILNPNFVGIILTLLMFLLFHFQQRSKK